MTPDLTVVVTNFGRPELLSRALSSCEAAGVTNIVVSSMCPDEKVLGILEEHRQKPGRAFFATTLPVDLGVNELWLRGLYYATTKYVLILHDDDYLDKDFGKEWREVLRPALEAGCGLVSWRGLKSIGDRFEECDYFEGPSRLLGTSALTQLLLQEHYGAVSPVVSVFRRADAIRALKEAGDCLLDPACFTRRTMLVGNDLLLYLRICEKYQTWFYHHKVLTYYGAWEGSETFHWESAGRYPRLLEAYNATRGYFKGHRFARYAPSPRLLHVWSSYVSKDAEDGRRNVDAAATWAPHYVLGDVLPFPVTDDMLRRTSKSELGDNRVLPFMRDVYDYVAGYGLEEDICFMTNADTAVVLDGPRIIRERFAIPGVRASFAWRHNFDHRLLGPVREIRQGRKDGGADLFAFKPVWWREYRDLMPDMVLACEAWDYVLRILIEESHTGLPFSWDGLVYHEWHDAPWRGKAFRRANRGQQHNCALARDFFLSRGERPDGVFPMVG